MCSGERSSVRLRFRERMVLEVSLGPGSKYWVAYQIRSFIEALITVNLEYLKEHPDTPRLYNSGVRYQYHGTGGELRTIQQCLFHGSADCGSLPAWRIAELIFHGEDRKAQPMISFPDGSSVYHCRVVRGDGRIEDPNMALGMTIPWGKK